MPRTSPFSERTERTVIAVIVLDLVLQTAETTEAMTNAATLFFWAGVAIWLLYTVEWFVRNPAGGGLEEVRIQLHRDRGLPWPSCRCGRSRDSI